MNPIEFPLIAVESHADSAASAATLRLDANEAFHRGDRPAALRCLEAAVEHDASCENLYALAHWYADAEEFAPAIHYLQAAWEEARRAGSPQWRARCTHALAELHRQTGQLELARRDRQLAIAAELDAGDTVNPASFLYDQTRDALHAGDVGNAERWLAALERTGGNRHDIIDPAALAMLQGVVAMRGGRRAHALRHFIEAYHRADRRDVLRGQAAANIGHVLQSRQSYQRAGSAFEVARREFERCGAVRSAASAGRSLLECRRFHAVLTCDQHRN